MNPTLAIEIWIWSAASYNYQATTDNVSEYSLKHYGRFIWIYVFAPYAAAVAAGLLSRKHYSILQEESQPSGE